jgi:hypothetical protein
LMDNLLQNYRLLDSKHDAFLAERKQVASIREDTEANIMLKEILPNAEYLKLRRRGPPCGGSGGKMSNINDSILLTSGRQTENS